MTSNPRNPTVEAKSNRIRLEGNAIRLQAIAIRLEGGPCKKRKQIPSVPCHQHRLWPHKCESVPMAPFTGRPPLPLPLKRQKWWRFGPDEGLRDLNAGLGGVAMVSFPAGCHGVLSFKS